MTRLASLLKLLLLLAALSFLKADDNCKPQTPDLTNECPEESECLKPEKDQMADFACPAGYDKEAKMDRRTNNLLYVEWRYVYGFQCTAGEWQGNVWKAKNTYAYEGRVLGTRCSRKKLLYDEKDCLVYEECRKPNIAYTKPKSAAITCDFAPPDDKGFTLQWKDGAWMNVDKPEKKTPELLFSEVQNSKKFRCVRTKCYFHCKEHCTGMCDKSKRFFFETEPINWVKCVEKTAEGVSKWKIGDHESDYELEPRELNDNSVCEDLCSVQSPMKSICIDGYRLCEEVEFNDHAVAKCNGTMMYTAPNGEGPFIGTDFQCDKNSGKWYLKLMNNAYKHAVKGGNVVCIHDNCDESTLFPTCEEAENCKQVIRDHDRFECPKSTSVWTRPNATADWEKHSGTDYLMCKKGKMLENGQDPLATGAQLRCKGQCSWSTNYIIMGVICLLAIR